MPKRVVLMGLWLAAAATAQPSAQPSALPNCQPPPEQVLAQLNALRASARSCGAAVVPAVPAAPPLRWHEQLATSASRYAEELAQRDAISHQGQAVRTLRERMRATGYAFKSVGENLAGGPSDLDEALQQWLSSREHCENLMQADFRDVGLACLASPGRYEYFWVLHLGRRNDASSAAD